MKNKFYQHLTILHLLKLHLINKTLLIKLQLSNLILVRPYTQQQEEDNCEK